MIKCLVLDLDNTLWGGVVGEDGPAGIALGVTPPGSGFLAFQQALLDAYNKGILLAINSKNNYADAMEVIEKHPFMVLRKDKFAATRINWNDKAQNLREIAEELNIGLDTFAFFDDDPLNRSMVRAEFPEVLVPELPKDPGDYVKFLYDTVTELSADALTDEDKMRGQLYTTERLRKSAEESALSKEDFLKDLGVEVHWYEDDASCLPRLSQMTERTNQFNVNKRIFTTEEIVSFVDDPRYGVYYISARDKFGDYGVVGFALAHKNGDVWDIEALLMSCRALGRGIEEAFLWGIAQRAHDGSARSLNVLFEESERNEPARDFLKKYFKNNTYALQDMRDIPAWVTLIWKN